VGDGIHHFGKIRFEGQLAGLGCGGFSRLGLSAGKTEDEAFVAIAGPRRNLVEEALGVPVEITNANFWHCNFNGLLPSL
jgi:hypothetical protein